jgi:hypothetical protein
MADLEKLGKEAASLWDSNSGEMSLNDAVASAVRGTPLKYEQLRRVCEFANREAIGIQKKSDEPRMTQTIKTAKPDEVADIVGTDKESTSIASPKSDEDKMGTKESFAKVSERQGHLVFPDFVAYKQNLTKQSSYAEPVPEPEDYEDDPKVSATVAAREMVVDLADAEDTFKVKSERLETHRVIATGKLSQAISAVTESGEVNVGEALALAKFAFDQKCRELGFDPLSKDFHDMTEGLAGNLIKTASAADQPVSPREDLFEIPVFVDHPLLSSARGLAKIAAAKRVYDSSAQIADTYRIQLVNELAHRVGDHIGW